MSEYVEKWNQELKRAKNEYSPEGWSFLNFVLPAVVVPLAIKAGTYAAKEIKKAIDKKKTAKK